MLGDSAQPRHSPTRRLFHRAYDERLRASQTFCRDMTRREARNFYWGFVALPKDQRTAIYALYDFARQVDDEVDLAGSTHGGNLFDHHRDRLRRCFAGEFDDPVMHVLAYAVDRYNIPIDELEALIRGVERDLEANRYETWEDLRQYCLLVASSVGRMCVRIFGYRDPVAFRHADDLGVAMQLANILRDVREDVAMGRIYLPREDLRRFGIPEEALLDGTVGGSWPGFMAFEISRALDCFASGLRVTEYIPRRAAVCVLTMAGIYLAILQRLSEDPYLPLTRRASLASREKIHIMLRSCLRAV